MLNGATVWASLRWQYRKVRPVRLLWVYSVEKLNRSMERAASPKNDLAKRPRIDDRHPVDDLTTPKNSTEQSVASFSTE
jgi:hypothetical protein